MIAALRSIDSILPESDGLKWFNWLYLQVTEAVGASVGQGQLSDAAWLADLDVRFASLYLNALERWLSSHGPTSGPAAPGCWSAIFRRRDDARLARIQFAIAGVNAHINHDLALAIVATCEASDIAPSRDSQQYRDYTSLNATLDSLIDTAKNTLRVGLLGQALPPLGQVEDKIGGWKVAAAREAAWISAEALWLIRKDSLLRAQYEIRLDELTTLADDALLVRVIAGRSD